MFRVKFAAQQIRSSLSSLFSATALGPNSVVALVDYNPGQSDLLAFQKGDVARVIKKTDHGWWFVGLNGIEGWVPMIYWDEFKVLRRIRWSNCRFNVGQLNRHSFLTLPPSFVVTKITMTLLRFIG